MSKEVIEQIIRTTVDEENVYLVDLELHGNERNLKIYVFVDTVSGITIAECEKLTRKILDRLELAELGNVNYSLEVSSPGLDRPLKHLWQYRKNIGRQLRVIFEEEDKQKTIEGELSSVSESGIVLTVSGNEINIPFEKIIKTRVLVSW